MKRLLLFLLVVALGASCGVPTGAPPAKEKETGLQMPPPPDHTRRFPAQDRIRVELVADHVMGKDFLPGGNVAEYEHRGTPFRMFLIETKSAEAAALLMYDYKAALPGAKFLPNFGGYFGQDGGVPTLIFPKGKFVAGVCGLPQEEADAMARELAARLN